jgi:tetratricopeptide (TPR) repeat protein
VVAKVYVSSTIVDLEAERQAVIDWLVAAQHQVVHSYRPNSDAVRDGCLADVDTCDLYVLILGHRYGFQPPKDNPEGLSITHLEFRRAGERGKPRVALLRTSIPSISLSDMADPLRLALVQAFRDEVADIVRAGEFGDLQGLVQELSTGVQAEWEKLQAKLAELEKAQANVMKPSLRRSAGSPAGQRDELTGGYELEAPRPAQLPRSIGDFTGRTDDLVRLRSWLDKRASGVPGAILISALAGQGGVGKTTLAVHLANEYRHEFPDGHFYVDLKGKGPREEALAPGDVLADFLRSLGVDGANIPDSVEARAAMFRSRLDGRRFLILLDNALNEEQVEPLLPASNLCAVLITSRSSLTGLEGVKRLPIDVMSKSDAVKLFTQLVSDDLIEAAPADAEAIVERCGYLPLAIRIAGAQVASSRDLRGFRKALDLKSTRLKALEHRNLDVRASLGLSYDHHISPAAQRAFRLLGLIEAPTFPSWVAAALIGEPVERADEVVREIQQAQLLMDADRDAAGLLRYRFHDLVHDLAGEYLSRAERAEGAERLVDAYTALAGCAQSLLEPPGPGDNRRADHELPLYLSAVKTAMNDDWLAWFSDDRHNLLDVIKTASQQELWAATSQLCELATTLMEVPSYWDEWSQVSDIALEANRRGGLRSAEALTLRHRGDLRVYQGHREEGRAYLQQSVEIFHDLGNKAGEAASLIRLAEVQRYFGDTDIAMTSMEQALAIYQDLDDKLGMAYALTSIGGVLRVQGRWDESIQTFLQCIPVLRAAGRRRQAAIALVSLGDVYHLKSMWDEAYRCFDECLALFTGLGDRMWMQNTRRHIGLVHVILGRPNDAIRYFTEALATFEQIGDRRKEALTQWAIGDAHSYERRHREAIVSYQKALTVFEDINDPFCAAHVLRQRAISGVKLRDPRAQQWTDASIAAAQERKQKSILAMARAGLAELLLDQNRPQEAIGVAKECLEIFRERGDRIWEAKALTCLAASYASLNDSAQSREFLTEAFTVYEDIHVPVPSDLQVIRSAVADTT